MNLNLNINDVSETALLTLYSHAFDAQDKNPILNDVSSVQTIHLLNKELSKSEKKLHKRLSSGKIDKKGIVHIAIRAKKYDKYILDFCQKNPNANIVNIGCGLDNRFERIDNGKVKFFDLDLPDIIDIKKQLFGETDRYHFISQSVFDFNWLENIPKNDTLFIAEGVFMYCREDDVKSLFLRLQENFPGSEMVCEVFNSLWIKGWLKKIMQIKMQKELHLGKNASFLSGIRDSHEMESWNQGITLLGDWSYFDSDEKKLGFLKLFRHINLFRKIQWTVHYRFEKITN